MADVRPTYQVEPDFAARQSIIWAIAWLVGAASLAVVDNLLLAFPDVLPSELSSLTHGRLAAVIDTAVVFGWLGSAGFAVVYGVLPRITEVQLHNEVLGAATTLTWAVVLTLGIGAVLFGVNQGRPLAELPAGADIALVLLLVFVLFNGAVTVIRRRERTVYVSGWYLLAAILLAPIIFVIGNLPVFTGVTDVIVSGWYQNGIEVLWLLPMALAAAHYVIPVETGNPLYSGQLAQAGFWSLLFVGSWTGHRFFVGGPGPDYLHTIAVAMTIVLIVPVASSVVNLLATGRGRWSLLTDTPGLRWAVIGVVLLGVWITAVAVGVVPTVAKYTSFTAYTTAVRQLAVWGAFSAFAFAFIYHAYPLMVGRDWYSRRAVLFHTWATVTGLAVATAALLARSAIQATVVVATAPDGLDAAVQATAGLFRLAALGSAVGFALIAAAQFAFAYNFFRTSRSGPIVRVLSAARVGSPA